MTNEALVAAVERLLVDTAGHACSITVDRELTAGANRRTVRLIVRRSADSRAETTSAIIQISPRDDERSGATLPVADEAAVIAAAADRGVPVAPVLVAANVPELGGAEILVTGEVAGQTIPRRILRAAAESSDGGVALTRACGRALARIHGIDPTTVAVSAPLPSFTPATYLRHLTSRLDDLPDPHPTFRFALSRLQEHLPATAPRPALVHGDFRNGNLIVVDDQGRTELAAVLDWELAHVGDPMEDLAWLCLRTWRFGGDQQEVGGFGSLDELRRAYVDAGGQWRSEVFDWWTMARTIWWGIGLAAQAAAYCRGRSQSLVHAASGRRVVELEYDLLGLLEPRDSRPV